MSTQQPAASAPATPYVPTWALYVYDDRAFLTFDGRLVATAACAMPAQQARVEATLARLNERARTSR